MYGHKNRNLGVDYCLMPSEAISPSIASPLPPSASLTLPSPSSPPVDWIMKKERIFLLAQFWQQRATLAEKEVTSLKEQLVNHSFRSNTGISMAPPPQDGEDPALSNPSDQSQDVELASKDKKISALMEDVQRLQATLSHTRESSSSQIRLLEQQLDNKQEMITRLEAMLDAQRDYDELKRQLTLLKMTSSNEIKGSTNESDFKQEANKGSPMNSSRFGVGSGSLPADPFGSLLGEELVATWRRSLERSLLSSSPAPQQPLPPQHSANDSWSPPTNHSSPGDSSPSSVANADNLSPLNGTTCGSNDIMPFRFEDSLIPKSDPMEAKLQEMLRYNMDKFGSQCLDTLQIARRVRELLSIHNIGQRLFAKYVLGLSQGTVSELLSKPKPWDKLTEKGRDSYRKMHAWAADEASVLLLKSLIPKKGKDGPTTNGGVNTNLFRCEESIGGPEDRIAHILAEANALHLNPQNDCDESASSKSPTNNNCQGPASPSSSSSRDRRLKKYEHDDISQEQVTRIYHEELAKLVGMSRLQHGVGLDAADHKLPREHYPSLIFPSLFGGALLEREDLRVAIDTYHREIVKQIASNSTAKAPSPPYPSNLFHISIPNGAISAVQDLSLPKRLSPTHEEEDDNKFDRDADSDAQGQVGSAFSLVRPKGSGDSSSGAPSPLSTILPPSCSDDCSTASPLQRMASITNSLISQPSAPSVSSPSQRPLKAVLPPITQQQFDQYNNLNTEEIVRKVKEQLSQYSISQRLFGESVLGLSQGSVSDLLARPKPWHMLTQKGREPFIRMKMFLEDENAVHKLVASQYKIAPEKLMRTGGYAGNPSPSISVCKSSTKITEIPKNIDTSPSPSANQAAQNSTSQATVVKSEPPPKEISPHIAPNVGLSTPSPSIGLAQQHSVYEMAALTQDLDTQLITTKIKEALLANNIGQKIFGEVVLGLSQGSVSELLSKPKPWHMLSIKGREPFIRMQLWLTDPLNVERLQLLKNERREANKRKRGLPYSSSPLDSYNSTVHGSSDASNDSQNESYSPGSSAAPPPSKKQRVLFTEEQKEALRLGFALDPYPNVSAIEFLARELGLSPRTITNWFHNHRMRLKQSSTSLSSHDPSLPSATPFDPTQFRLLFQQRLMEIHKELYPMQSSEKISSGTTSNEGLDLSVNNFCRTQSDNEDEYFEEDEYENEIENSIFSDESSTSSASKLYRRKKSKSTAVMSASPLNKSSSLKDKNSLASSSGSSRRKPVAPQWLNPSWRDDSDDDDVVINGVCVLNTAADGKSGDGATEPISHGVKVELSEHESSGLENDDDEDNKREGIKRYSKKGGDPNQTRVEAGACASTAGIAEKSEYIH